MKCHDPRISSDRSHKVETDNPALIAAEMALQMFPGYEVNWERVTVMANWSGAKVSAETPSKA